MAKLGALLIRTVAKPIAKGIRTQSKTSKPLMELCRAIGQIQNKLSLRVHIASSQQQSTTTNVRHYTIKPLPMDQAIDKGADLLGEVFIFTVAATIVTLEYQRSVEKSLQENLLVAKRDNEDKQKIHDRFKSIETRIKALEKTTKTDDKNIILPNKIPKLG